MSIAENTDRDKATVGISDQGRTVEPAFGHHIDSTASSSVETILRDLQFLEDMARGDDDATLLESFRTAGADPRLVEELGTKIKLARVASPYIFRPASELRHLPPPVWLVDRLLTQDSFALLHGKEGIGKSFLALDLGLSVANGVDWHGRTVAQGDVAYIAAEGQSGLAPRIEAWGNAHGIGEPFAHIHVLGLAPNLRDEKRAKSVAAGLRLLTGVQLVVVDTLARTLVGGDENSAQDMGLFVAHVDEIRRATGACVLVVHHQPRAATNPRGSTALQGAVSTILRLEEANKGLTLKCDKQKDAEPHEAIRLSREIVQLEGQRSSCVINSRDVDTSDERHDLTPKERSTFEVLRSNPAGLTATKWQRACAPEGVSSSTFYASVQTLVERGMVERKGSGRGARYTEVGAITPVALESLQRE